MKLNIFLWIESFMVVYNSKKEKIIVIIEGKYKKEYNQYNVIGKNKMKKGREEIFYCKRK